MKKKLVITALAAAILSSTMAPVAAQAAEHVDQPVSYEKEYSGVLSDENKADDYLVKIPGNGTFTVSGLVDHDGVISITDKDGTEDLDYKYFKDSVDDTATFHLKKGTYRVRVATGCTWDEDKDHYNISCQYHLDTPGAVKLESKKKGTIKVSAEKEGAVSGYRIKYRKAGGTWRTTTVRGNSALSYSLTGLESKAKYQIQVRRFVMGSSDDVYYSSWSKTQTVKVK